MYQPKQHEETRLEVLHALIRSHPLGTWVAPGAGELVVNHVPFLIDPSRGGLGTLVAHVARANPVWQMPPGEISCVVAFQGPETYISPSWYPGKHEHGKAVPTWNYAVVHAHGQPSFIHDRAWLLEHLNRLTDEHESAAVVPWKVGDAPADFIARMVAGIVGVEIAIERIEGKWKTSQNRSDDDKRGVVAGLLGKDSTGSRAMASLVSGHIAPRDQT